MKLSIKIMFAFLVLLGYSLNAQLSFSSYPRTIKVEGESKIQIPADILDLQFSLISESIKSKVKLPLDKVEAQIKNHLTQKKIPLFKLETKADPAICNLNSKEYTLKKLTLAEYSAIYSYFSKHLFISDLYINNATIYKQTIQKQFDILISECAQSAKKKGESIARLNQENIIGIQSINGYNVFELTNNDYTYNVTFDSIVEKAEFNMTIPVEYRIEDKLAPANGFSLPRLIYTSGRAEQSVKTQSAKFNFNHSLKDYEEGEPSQVYEAAKKSLESMLKAHNATIISAKKDAYYYNASDEFSLDYVVEVKNYDNIIALYKALNSNKNVTFANSTSQEEKLDYLKLNEQLLPKAIESSENSVKILAKHFGVEVLRKFDYVDSQTGFSPDYAFSSTDFEKKIEKRIYLNYEMK